MIPLVSFRHLDEAARNLDGTVIMYSDHITQSMKQAIEETERRRRKQLEYNKRYAITPKSIVKPIAESIGEVGELEVETKSMARQDLVEACCGDRGYNEKVC